MADTIKEFLVGLGFKVDRESLRHFHEGIEQSHRSVKEFAVAVGAMAVAVEESIRRVATRFDELYFMSQRTGVSVKNLQLVRFALGGVGIEADAASRSLQSIATSLRDSPGLRGVAQFVAPGFKDAKDVLEGFGKQYHALIERFGKDSPQLDFAALRFRRLGAMFGLSGDDLRQLGLNWKEYQHQLHEAEAVYRAFQINSKQASDEAHAVVEAWRLTWLTLNVAFNKFVLATFPAVKQLLEEFAHWMVKDGAEAVNGMVASIKEFFGNEKNRKELIADFKMVGSVVLEVGRGIALVGRGIIELNKHLGATGTLLTVVFGVIAARMAVGGLLGLAARGGAALLGAGTAAAGAGAGAVGAGGLIGSMGGGLAAGTAGLFLPDSMMPKGGVEARREAFDTFRRWVNRQITGAKPGEERIAEPGRTAGSPGPATWGPMAGGSKEFRGPVAQWLLDLFRGGGRTFEAPIPPPGRQSSRGGISPTLASYSHGGSVGDPLQLLMSGFGGWWSGATNYRPIVVIAEEFYHKFADMLRLAFGLEGVAGGSGAGGGAGGGSGMGGRSGGRFSGMGPRRGGGDGSNWQLGNVSGTGAGHTATKAERIAFYREYAKKKGLDEKSILATIAGEGLNVYTGDHGTSFGDFQLHVGGGMGDAAMKAGINVRDPNKWKEQGMFAMDRMAEHKGNAAWYLGQWHGAPGWAGSQFSNPRPAGAAPAGGAPTRGIGGGGKSAGGGIDFFLGDSIARGLALATGIPHEAIDGQSPKVIYERLKDHMANFTGKTVALASGSNTGGDARQLYWVHRTIDELQKAGAKVALLGVGQGVKGSRELNQGLEALHRRFNVPFTGELETTEGIVHPRNQMRVFDQLKRSLGAEGGSTGPRTSIESDHNVNIHVTGSPDPHGTARAIQEVQGRQSALHMRNLKTALV